MRAKALGRCPMSNVLLTTIVLAALAVHLAASVASVVSRRHATPLLVTNLGFSALALIASLSKERYLILPTPDWPAIDAAAFELLVFGLAAGGLGGSAVAQKLSTLLFVIDLLACVAAAVFVLTFHMTRLI